MKFGSVCALAIAPALALAVPGTANAAVFLDFDGSDGVFGNDNVTAVTFSDEFVFDTGVSAGQLSATISSIASSDPSSNIDFTSVILNGVEFDIVQIGRIEFRTIEDLFIPDGLQTLVVSGSSGGTGSYSGTLAFATATAVPEPAAWAFMIFGFGAVGSRLRSNRRRQRKANVKINYA